jgi:hypothetical protein
VLVVPTGTDDRYTGIVGSVDDKTIEITLSRPIDGLTRAGATTEVEARFITPSAMYRLVSKAKVHSGKGARLSLGRAGSLERVQRRRFPRVAAALPVAVAAFSTETRTFVALEGLTIDLSAGGLSLLTTTKLPAEQPAHLALTLPGGVLNAMVRVVDELEHEGRFQYRLALEHCGENDLDLLARYVNREAANASDQLEPQGAEP